MIAGLTPEEERDLILSVGTHRADRRLSPGEVAQMFAKALAAGATRSQLADACQLEGTTWVGRFLRLNELPPTTRALVDWGRSATTLSMTAAQEVARLDSPTDMDDLALRTLEAGLSGTEVRDIVQVVRRSGVSVDEAVTSQLRLRPHVQKHFVYAGLIPEGQLRTKLSTMTQAERDRLMAEFLRVTSIANALGRLSSDRFLLSGDELELDIDAIEAHLATWLSDAT